MRPILSGRDFLFKKGGWFAIGLALLLGAACSSELPSKAAAGDAAPHFNLPTLSGERASLDQARGQVAIVIFWRTD